MTFPTDFASWITFGVIAVFLAVGLIVAIWLAAGLFQARSLFRREFSAYFLSPIAYGVLVVFFIMTGIVFHQRLGFLPASGGKGVEYPVQNMLRDETVSSVY